jgi:hypothetical protein
VLDRYCVKVYNERYIKVSVCHGDREGIPTFNGAKCTAGERNDKVLTDDEIVENLKRSAKRAYQNLLAKAHGLGVDRMLTLTFAKNVTVASKRVAVECFQRFIRACRARFGAFNYVATMEVQKRGAIHFHLGVTRYYIVWVLWELWKSAVVASGLAESCDKIGSVFINKKAKQSKNGVVAYIAKYILKESYKQIETGSNLRDKFGKRYFASLCPVEKVIFITGKGDCMYVFSTFFETFEIKTNKRAFLKEFKRVELFILGCDWSFSSGFLNEKQ